MSLVFVIALLYSNRSYCLNKPFKSFNTKNGLSSNTVYSCVKDQKGYIWITTSKGINRYNGEDFSVITLEDKDYKQEARAVVVSSDGHLHAYNEHRLYYFNDENQRFEIIKKVNFAHKEYIKSVVPDNRGNIWLGTTEGLYLFSPPVGLRRCSGNFRNLATISFDQKGLLWIGAFRGLHCYNSRTHQEEAFRCPKQFRNTAVSSVFKDELSGLLWIATKEKGTWILNEKNQLLSKVPDQDLRGVLSVQAVAKSKIWITTDNGHIKEYNRFTGIPESDYLNQTVAENDSQTRYAHAVYADVSSIWICTARSGLILYSTESLAERVFKIEKPINAIAKLGDSLLFVGAQNNLIIFKKRNKTLAIQPNNYGIASTGEITDLTTTNDGRLLIATANKVLVHDREGKVLSTIFLPAKEKLNCVYQDPNKDIWMGCSSALYKFDSRKKKLKHFAIEGVTRIKCSNFQELFLLSANGLFSLNFSTNKYGRVDLAFLKGTSKIPSDLKINCLLKDSRNNTIIWIGTKDFGLLKYSILQRKIDRFTTAHGLASNTVNALTFDKLHRLWITAPHALSCYDQESGEISTCSDLMEPGLPTFNSGYKCVEFNERLYITNGNALIQVDPLTFFNKDTEKLNVHFERLDILSNNIKGYKQQRKNYHLDDSQTLILRSTERSFRINFTDVSPLNNESNLYTWNLEGFENGWTEPNRIHRATYVNIPPGTYMFRLRVLKADNPNNFTERTIKIIIQPPFWLSSPAYCLYIIISISVASYLIIRYKARLEKKEAENKSRFIMNIAQDLETPLSLIKMSLQEIQKEQLSIGGKKSLSTAENSTEDLLNMVMRILEHHKMEEDSQQLNLQKLSLHDEIKNAFNVCQIEAKKKFVDLRIDKMHLKMDALADKQKLAYILENLLRLTLKYTESYGYLHLVATAELASLRVSFTGQLNFPQTIFNELNSSRKQYFIKPQTSPSETNLIFIKKLINLHGGTLQIKGVNDSDRELTLNIPIQACEAKDIDHCSSSVRIANRRTEKEENIGSRNIELLVIDENEALRAYLAEYLGKKYQILTSGNAEEALEITKEHLPDLIISAIILPSMSGIDLCRVLKARMETCHIPFILLTSLSDKSDVINGFNAGADDYVTKPFDMNLLEIKIIAHLKNRALYKRKFLDNALIAQHAEGDEEDKLFLQKTISLIEQYLQDETLSIEFISKQVAMSRSVFNRRIKALTGQTPKDLIREIKMKKAAQLLSSQKYTVYDVAYLTGYPNSKYFSTSFKKYYGMPPSAYIENQEEKNSVIETLKI